MKITQPKLTDLVYLAEQICTTTNNILFLEVIVPVELVDKFTDVDLSEFLDEEGMIDYGMAYDSLEEEGIIEEVYKEIDSMSIRKINKFVKDRYEELNSLPTSIKLLMNAMTDMTNNLSEEVNKINPETQSFINKVVDWSSKKEV